MLPRSVVVEWSDNDRRYPIGRPIGIYEAICAAFCAGIGTLRREWMTLVHFLILGSTIDLRAGDMEKTLDLASRLQDGIRHSLRADHVRLKEQQTVVD